LEGRALGKRKEKKEMEERIVPELELGGVCFPSYYRVPQR